MCGFAGVVVWDEKYRVSPETLRQMSARIAHRGPDGEGVYLNHEGEITPDRPQVGLVHRRLAILDLDPRANQPFTDHQGRWAVFNGEIYNFRELRAELEKLKPDYQWRTTGDTEVLLVAYDVWGEKCVERFNGMFAFAIWDEPRKSLFLARDRMGQKPLYVAYLSSDGRPARSLYHLNAPGLPAVVAFASELSALTDLRWVDRTIDQDQLDLYLSVGYIIQGTIYLGIRELRPASRLRLKGGADGIFDEAPYFSPVVNPLDSPRVSAADIRRLVHQAVQRQLVSDVPIGCFLSGGVDSSVVTAAMKVAGADVSTFSIGFDDRRYDESKYARKVAEHLGTRHQEFVVRTNAAEDLPKLARAFGQPFGDSSALPTHYLSCETRRYVKVALSGDGGDELFGGYDRYRAMALAEKISRMPRPIRAFASGSAWQQLPGSHPKSSAARFKRLVGSLGLPPDERYARYVRLFDTDAINQLLGDRRTHQGEADNLVGLLGVLLHQHQVVPAVMALDRMVYLPGDLLAKVDHCSMLHALEVRSPFMDHELVTFAAGLTTDQLLKGGPKRMLREAFAADLPPWVFKRKKMGFAVPIGQWFRGELRSMLRDNLFSSDSFANAHFNMKVVQRLVDEHEQERVDHSQRLYALLMLELWWREARH